MDERKMERHQDRKSHQCLMCKQNQIEEAEERGEMAVGSRSEGSRDERKSREEGCGRAVFTGHGHTVYENFVSATLSL